MMLQGMSRLDSLPRELIEDIAAKKAGLETMRLTFTESAQGHAPGQVLVERAMGSKMCTVSVKTLGPVGQDELSDVHQTAYVRASQQVRGATAAAAAALTGLLLG